MEDLFQLAFAGLLFMEYIDGPPFAAHVTIRAFGNRYLTALNPGTPELGSDAG